MFERENQNYKMINQAVLTVTRDSDCARLQRLYDKMAVTLEATLQNGCNIAVYSAKLLVHVSTYL